MGVGHTRFSGRGVIPLRPVLQRSTGALLLKEYSDCLKEERSHYILTTTSLK